MSTQPNAGVHSPEHEALLVAALADEHAEHTREFSARLAECAECRQRFAKLSAVRELLDDAGREERETLAELDWNQKVPGSDTVAPFVRAMAQKRKQKLRSTRTRRLTMWVVSAAAGVMFVGWLVRLLVPAARGKPGDSLLSATKLSSWSPQGPVIEYCPFMWDLKLPEAGHYELRIWEVGPKSTGKPFVTERAIKPEWFASPLVTRKWPDKIRWEVIVYDATGALLPDRVDATAERLQR